MNQDTQNTSNLESSSLNTLDDLWTLSPDSNPEGNPQSNKSNTQFGMLDWGDLEDDNDLWDGIEAASSLGMASKIDIEKPDEVTSEAETANKAKNIASSLVQIDVDKGFVGSLHHGDKFLKDVPLAGDDSYKSEKDIQKELFDELMTEMMKPAKPAEDNTQKTDDTATDADENKKESEKSENEPKSDKNIECVSLLSDEDTEPMSGIDEYLEVETKIVNAEDALEHSELELDTKSEDEEDEEDSENSAASDDDKQKTDSDEDEDDEAPAIRLSERAKMGRLYPENDVIESDHELKPDFYYPEEVIKQEVATSRKNHGLIWVSVILIGVLLGGLLSWLFIQSQSATIHYAQKGTFQTKGSYQHIYTSKDGKFVAMCSDEHGVLEAGGVPVSEFWPQNNGCKELKLSSDGKKLWYLNHSDELFEVALEKSTGFNPQKIATLTDKDRPGFDIDEQNQVIYFARVDKTAPVIRKLNLQTMKSTDEALPDDAFLCDGLSARQYAYASKDSLYLVSNGNTTTVSLNTPKLGCSREFFYTCTSNDDNAWSVLCRNSIHQGKGKSAEDPVQIEDVVAIRSGIRGYHLLRNSDGTDYISTKTWIHVDNRNNLSKIDLSEKLDNGFAIARIDDPKTPFIGMSAGSWFKMTEDGQISHNIAQNSTLVATSFVGDGSHLASFTRTDKDGSEFTLWDLREAKIVENVSFDAPVQSINVSDSGGFGFVITGNTTSKLHWFAWNTGQQLGSIDLQKKVIDASWSDDEEYVLLQYEDGSHDLFRRDSGITPIRSYTPDTILAFANNGLMWRIDDNALTTERIADGALSVIYNNMTDRLRSIDVKGIVPHPYSDDLIFYGNKGLILYNVATKQTIKTPTPDPIVWVTPDRQGKFAATSAGVLELSTGSILRISNDPQQKLQWLGSDQYLVTQDGTQIIHYPSGNVSTFPPKAYNITYIGNNSGLHPTGDFVSAIRDNKISIEKLITKDISNTLAVFSGEKNYKWCWIASNGSMQGQGSECTYMGKDRKAITIPANDPAVIENMKQQMPSVIQNQFKPTEVAFVDDVSFSVKAVPENASIIFAAVSGDLPKELTSDTGITAPFETTLKRDDRWFAAVLMAPEYEQRTITFQLNVANTSLRVPMLREGAADISLAWLDNEDFSVVEVSEDLTIELKSLLQEHRTELKNCLKQANSEAFSIIINNQNQLEVPPGLGEALEACITPSISAIQEKATATGGLPGLADLDNVRIGIAIP